MQRKTGARGLRTILENVLLDTMYDLPSMRNVAKVVVDEAVIEGQTEAVRRLRVGRDATTRRRARTVRTDQLSRRCAARHARAASHRQSIGAACIR